MKVCLPLQPQTVPGTRHGLPAPPLYAVREALLRVRLPRRRIRQERGRRHRQPDLSPLLGCRYCMASCPYHARYFNWYDPIWPEGMEKTLTPDVSVRPRGVVEKCTFCHHRWMKAKDKAIAEGRNPYELADGEYVTSCTEVCPNGAISFGDSKNPEHKVYELIRSPHAIPPSGAPGDRPAGVLPEQARMGAPSGRQLPGKRKDQGVGQWK